MAGIFLYGLQDMRLERIDGGIVALEQIFLGLEAAFGRRAGGIVGFARGDRSTPAEKRCWPSMITYLPSRSTATSGVMNPIRSIDAVSALRWAGRGLRWWDTHGGVPHTHHGFKCLRHRLRV